MSRSRNTGSGLIGGHRTPGRPKKKEVIPPKNVPFLDQCDWGAKENSDGHLSVQRGWKLHLAAAEVKIPLTMVHDKRQYSLSSGGSSPDRTVKRTNGPSLQRHGCRLRCRGRPCKMPEERDHSAN